MSVPPNDSKVLGEANAEPHSKELAEAGAQAVTRSEALARPHVETHSKSRPKTQPAIPPATRAAALRALADFVPAAGHAYARGRNTDPGPEGRHAVSKLSPYLRHRLLLEREVVSAALSIHSLEACEKFVQEVFWRTYFKGWLEHHPGLWPRYVQERDAAIAAAAGNSGVSHALALAMTGRTGIECFDAWVAELCTTGYLHNHARMWFASIWIFTLRLPWQIGADFFMTHLLDGDPASNTLSWRWVAGLHTKGKHYLARAENIARFTEGRFNPTGQLNEGAEALVEAEPPQRRALDWNIRPGARVLHAEPLVVPASTSTSASTNGRTAVLLTDDDLGGPLCASSAVPSLSAETVALVDLSRLRSHGTPSPLVAKFVTAALDDAAQRIFRDGGAGEAALDADWRGPLAPGDQASSEVAKSGLLRRFAVDAGVPNNNAGVRAGAADVPTDESPVQYEVNCDLAVAVERLADEVDAWLCATSVNRLRLAWPVQGPARTFIERLLEKLDARDVEVEIALSDWDRSVWAHADRGFFKVKNQIPNISRELGLDSSFKV